MATYERIKHIEGGLETVFKFSEVEAVTRDEAARTVDFRVSMKEKGHPPKLCNLRFSGGDALYSWKAWEMWNKRCGAW